MKRVVLFFLSLCFLLLGACAYAQTNVQVDNVSYTLKRFEKAQQAEKVRASHHDLSLTNNSDLPESDSRFIFSVEDDDEGHEDLIRKHLSNAKYILAFSYVFILQYQSTNQADPLPFFRHIAFSSTPKYISQRVLRV